jgi:ubiquinone/menaquinone biosynthesis C-methylase UbiE
MSAQEIRLPRRRIELKNGGSPLNAIRNSKAPTASSFDPADLFQREWEIYRKVLDKNYLFHREAYSKLRQILTEEMSRPFRFLDIACGDASATIQALVGTNVDHYHGIDLSRPALTLAQMALRSLACRVELMEGDFVKIVREWREPVDVVWIGLSLHHLRTAAKLETMRDIRRILGARGTLLLYENTSPDGEDRANWLRRWDNQAPQWTALTSEEWNILAAHVHAADFPETKSTWHGLGREAGFTKVREMFVSPSDLFRLYSFSS